MTEKNLSEKELKWLRANFKIVRKNALANPNLYGGRYTQKRFREAFEEYKQHIESIRKEFENESWN